MSSFRFSEWLHLRKDTHCTRVSQILWSSASAKKLLQQLGALSSQYASTDLDLMIQPRMVQDMHQRVHSAGLWVFRAVNQSANAGMHQRTCTHGTRLNRGEQFTITEAMIANCLSRLAKCDHLGVGSGIGISNVAIESPANDLSVADNHGSHRHFASLKRTLSSTQSLLHPKFVAC